MNQLASVSFDYDEHDYAISSDCLPEYDGFCLNDGVLNDSVCFSPADTDKVVCICP